jgi:hypothetical protein
MVCRLRARHSVPTTFPTLSQWQSCWPVRMVPQPLLSYLGTSLHYNRPYPCSRSRCLLQVCMLRNHVPPLDIWIHPLASARIHPIVGIVNAALVRALHADLARWVRCAQAVSVRGPCRVITHRPKAPAPLPRAHHPLWTDVWGGVLSKAR